MLVTRRNLLRAAPALLFVPTALAACATSPTVLVSLFSSDAQLILNGLVTLNNDPQITAALNGTDEAAVQVALQDAKTVLADVTAVADTAVAAATAQGWMQQLNTDVSTVIQYAQMIPNLDATSEAIITAVGVLMPVILSVVGSSLPTVSATPAEMTPDEARTVLKAKG